MINETRLFILILLALSTGLHAQSLKVEDMKNVFKNKLLTISGRVSANSVLNMGNETTDRDPFTY